MNGEIKDNIISERHFKLHSLQHSWTSWATPVIQP